MCEAGQRDKALAGWVPFTFLEGLLHSSSFSFFLQDVHLYCRRRARLCKRHEVIDDDEDEEGEL